MTAGRSFIDRGQSRMKFCVGCFTLKGTEKNLESLHKPTYVGIYRTKSGAYSNGRIYFYDRFPERIGDITNYVKKVVSTKSLALPNLVSPNVSGNLPDIHCLNMSVTIADFKEKLDKKRDNVLVMLFGKDQIEAHDVEIICYVFHGTLSLSSSRAACMQKKVKRYHCAWGYVIRRYIWVCHISPTIQVLLPPPLPLPPSHPSFVGKPMISNPPI